MTAGEGGSRSLACIVGEVEHVIPKAIRPAWCCHAFGVSEEPVAEVGEDACGNLLCAYGEVVELRSGDGQEHEDDVVGKEGAEHDESRQLKLFITTEEIVEIGDEHQREVADVA